ncbi:MAG: hypothetical protein V4564_05285 [Pseudomonadota bacterium]|uniref:hypothetical protein n=1 Tax=Sphingomonas sp. ERG5 TaxID=1381597 RepID=UPI00054C023D|nr:hypothetical protein [Sphingomonas sp. ERG5]
MKTMTFAALLAVSALAQPATAETLKKVPVALNPAKAYILIEYRQLENPMADFPGSRKTLPLTTGLSFAHYDPVLGDIRGLGKASANPLPSKTPATEYFRNREIVRGDGARLHLLEVDPDTWVIQAWGTTSFSLGSYSFKAEAGTVTDLGVVEGASDWAEGDHAMTGGGLMKMALLGPFGKRPAVAPMRASIRPRTATDMAIPAELATAQIKPVEFTKGATFGNYLGGLVNRIEGVNATAKEAK